jgi:hypothetical protein
MPSPAAMQEPAKQDHDHYTVACWRWPGSCTFGDKCTFVHGANDTRPCVAAAARARKARDTEQPEPPHAVGPTATPALLEWLKDRLHSAKVTLRQALLITWLQLLRSCTTVQSSLTLICYNFFSHVRCAQRSDAALYSLSTVLEVLQNVTEGQADVLHLTLTACFDLCEALLKQNCEHELKESICYALLNIVTNSTVEHRGLAAVLPATITKHAAYTLVQLCHGCMHSGALAS